MRVCAMRKWEAREGMNKKKAKLEKDIEENLKKQEEQRAEIEKQKQIFETNNFKNFLYNNYEFPFLIKILVSLFF